MRANDKPNLSQKWRLKRYSVPRVSGILVSVILVIAVFSICNRYFLTTENILSLLRVMSSLAIMSLGQLLVIVAGEIDLSVGAVYGLGAMLLGILWMHGFSVFIAIPLALLTGILIGIITASLVNYVKIPSFVVTLGMLNVAQGITLLISNSKSISPAYSLSSGHGLELALFNALAGAHLPFDIPAQVLWMFGIAVIIGIAYDKFLFGFRLKAIGGNSEAAKLMKLPVVKYKFYTFAACGLLASLAGILDFSFIGTTDPSSGSSLTFPVFAAVIIGGASLSGGQGSVMGTLIAAGLLTILSNGLSLLGVGSFAQLVFIGFVTIAAVAIDKMRNKDTFKSVKGVS